MCSSERGSVKLMKMEIKANTSEHIIIDQAKLIISIDADSKIHIIMVVC